MANRFLCVVAALSLLQCPTLFAAKIKKINKKKRIVLIDVGSQDGVKKGEKICFYKKNKKIACGKVKKTKKKKSYVRVKRIKAIKKKHRVKRLGVEKKRRRGRKKKIEKIVPYSFAVRPLYLPYPTSASPASYNILVYNGALAEEGESVWKADRTFAESEQSVILESFGGELEWPQWHFRLGGRLKNFRPYGVDSDYGIANTALFAFTVQSASAIGFFLDFPYYISGGFSLALGIDIDSTTVSLLTKMIDQDGVEAEKTLYDATASANIVSLRIPVRWDPHWFDPLGFSLGINIMIPVLSFGETINLLESDDIHGAKNENPVLDIQTALDLKPGSYSIELIGGLFLGF